MRTQNGPRCCRCSLEALTVEMRQIRGQLALSRLKSCTRAVRTVEPRHLPLWRRFFGLAGVVRGSVMRRLTGAHQVIKFLLLVGAQKRANSGIVRIFSYFQFL